MEGFLKITNISRGDGRTAIAAAAYRSGEDLTSNYTGLEYDYSHKGSVESARIYLPRGSPKELGNRETLWNTIASLEKRKDAVEAKEILCAIPHGLTDEQRGDLVREFCQSLTEKGIICDACIHNPPKHDDLGRPVNAAGLPEKDPEKYIYDNPHVHIMAATRTIGADGKFVPKTVGVYICRNLETGEQKNMTQAELKSAGNAWQKQYKFLTPDGVQVWSTRSDADLKGYKRVDPYPLKLPHGRAAGSAYINSADFVTDCRKNWGRLATEALSKAGIPETVEMRSYKTQGSEKIGQKHKGPVAQQIDRKADRYKAEGRDPRTIVYSAIYNINVEIRKHNHMVDLYAAQEKEAEEIQYEANRYGKLLSTYRSEWISAKAHRMQLKKQLSNLSAGIDDLRDKIEQFQKTEKSIRERLDGIAQKIEALKSEKHCLHTENRAPDDIASLFAEKALAEQLLSSLYSDYGYKEPTRLKKDINMLTVADTKIKELEEMLPEAAKAETAAKEKYLECRNKIPVRVKKYVTETIVQKQPVTPGTPSALGALMDLATEIVMREIEEVEYEDEKKQL